MGAMDGDGATASEIKMACAWRRGCAGGGKVRRPMERQAASGSGQPLQL